MLFGHRLPLQPEHKLFADKFIEGGQIFRDLDGQSLQIVLLKHLPHQVPEEGFPPVESAVEEHKMALCIAVGDDVRQRQGSNQDPATPRQPDAIQRIR